MTPDPQQQALKGLRGHEKIVREAQDRFDRCVMWESTARNRQDEDEKFYEGDSDNLFQWPDAVKNSRGFGTDDERPCLTINKTRQHVLQILNDARQNKTSISIKPVGNEATFEAAQVFEGIIRHIEYISNAQSAYMTAQHQQVVSGLGWWRVVTDYADDQSFDQEIYIKRIKDRRAVYMDPDINEADGSDARFAFIFDDMPRDEFERRYPDFQDQGAVALDNKEGWLEEKHVRIAEYFRKVERADKLVMMQSAGRQALVKASDLPPRLRKVLDDPNFEKRDITTSKIEWYLIIGDKIAQEREWAGKYIPIVRCYGEESVINGELDRKGHVRALKDSQRMLNYNASAQVEFGALQTKIPFIAPVESIEGYETYWRTANVQNHSVLPYNAYTDAGQGPLPAPTRAEPPAVAPAYALGLQTAENHMMLVSGQYQADMGAPSNERSGKAIAERQRQGENSTYHFIDHFAMAVRFTGKIILDLIPKIYDTRRIVKILGEDGTSSEVLIDPMAQQAYAKQRAETGQQAEQVIVNPNVGRYEVMSDVGVDYGTKRQEAFNAFTQLMQADPEMRLLVGDLWAKTADFPYANEAAERLERMVPPQAKGEDGMQPQIMQMQQQMQTMQGLIGYLQQQLKSKDDEIKVKQEQKEIDKFKALTDRLEVVLAHYPDPRLAAEQAHEVELVSHETTADMLKAEQAAQLQSPPQESEAA